MALPGTAEAAALERSGLAARSVRRICCASTAQALEVIAAASRALASDAEASQRESEAAAAPAPERAYPEWRGDWRARPKSAPHL